MEHQAARVPTNEPKPPAEPSGILPKTIDPSVLSESTRASLQERAGIRHASDIPAASVARHRFESEPLRRGQVMQRVQALETDEGVTVLSNRMQTAPAPSVAAAASAQRPAAPRSVEPTLEDEAIVVAPGEGSNMTETHSLRPISSRTVNPSNGTGLGWLLWPFVLFVATGAVVGTLWFRKKVE